MNIPAIDSSQRKGIKVLEHRLATCLVFAHVSGKSGNHSTFEGGIIGKGASGISGYKMPGKRDGAGLDGSSSFRKMVLGTGQLAEFWVFR